MKILYPSFLNWFITIKGRPLYNPPERQNKENKNNRREKISLLVIPECLYQESK